MRGQLSIRSARAPYRRAGLAWLGRDPVEVDIRMLDGERLFRLIKDPILTIKISDENGAFKALPTMPSGFGPKDLQFMIDSMGESLPDLPAALIDPVLADGRTLEGLADRLKEAGVTTIDELFDKFADTAAELESVQAQLIARNGEMIERNNELLIARQRVAELEAASAASSSPSAGESQAEEQPQETKPAPRKAAVKKS